MIFSVASGRNFVKLKTDNMKTQKYFHYSQLQNKVANLNLDKSL